MDGWVDQQVGSCKISKNEIKCDLIEIIQFCLKFYDLWRHPHVSEGGWLDVWVNGWVHVKSVNI